MLPSLIFQRRTTFDQPKRSRPLAAWMRCVAAGVLMMMLGNAAVTAQTTADPYATSSYVPGLTTGYTGGPPIAFQGLPNWSGLTPAWLTGNRNPSLAGLNANPLNFFPGLNQASDRLWLRAEYLYWWTEAMDTPPLVTTSPDGTDREDAGVLGLVGTSILFGGEINDDPTHGMRLKAGFFLTPSTAFGIEGEYFGLAEQDDSFSASTGRSIVARPFYRTDTDEETAQLVDFPAVVDGSLSVRSRSDLRSFLLAGRASLCPTCGGNCVACRSTDRVDWIVGYRYMELEDSLSFKENLTSLGPGGDLTLSESFATKNEFNGLQLGVTYQANLKRVWLESLLRVAVGNNSQLVRIAGQTSITEFGVTENYEGGLLAQRTNSGTYDREKFTMIPELGLTVGIRFTDWLYATAGYSLVYLPAVVRAGDQIDTDVNPGLLPPEADPPIPGNRPRFEFVESDYWAQGLNLGVQLQF